MTCTASAVFLFNVQTNSAEQAELIDAITEKQLADWEAEWVPETMKAVQRLHRAGVEMARWPQSRNWNWKQKAAAVKGFLAYPGFSVVCDGLTQGMMLADTTGRCKLSSQQNSELVYVHFLENAPWNRAELCNPPRYRGVGSILIRAAIELSIELEFKGRIGLHSLPQANSFYANTCGMTDLGPDLKKEGLRYFEMTSEQAQAFIKKGGSS